MTQPPASADKNQPREPWGCITNYIRARAPHPWLAPSSHGRVWQTTRPESGEDLPNKAPPEVSPATAERSTKPTQATPREHTALETRGECTQPFCSPMVYSLQAPLSMGFPRQGYWSGLPFPSLGDLPDPGIEPTFLPLAGGFSLPLSRMMKYI